jgi:probable phosphoglycerate mutase
MYQMERKLMTHLYLIRHGDYIDEVDGKLVDHGLSEKGVQQVERLRDRLARTSEIKADVLIASTLPRARHTAEILAPALDPPIIFDKEFEEWYNEDGSLSEEEFMSRWKEVPVAQKPFYRWVPGCENWMEFALRVRLAFDRILTEYEGKTIAVICHGGIVEVAFLHLMELSWANLRLGTVAVDHASITHWKKVVMPDSTTRWFLKGCNDTLHLNDKYILVDAPTP